MRHLCPYLTKHTVTSATGANPSFIRVRLKLFSASDAKGILWGKPYSQVETAMLISDVAKMAGMSKGRYPTL